MVGVAGGGGRGEGEEKRLGFIVRVEGELKGASAYFMWLR